MLFMSTVLYVQPVLFNFHTILLIGNKPDDFFCFSEIISRSVQMSVFCCVVSRPAYYEE